MLVTDFKTEEVSHATRRIVAIVGGTFLPWLAAVCWTAGIGGGLHFIAYVLLALATGYTILTLTLRQDARAENLFLAPAAGILVLSSISALLLRARSPMSAIFAIWLALALPGANRLWSDRKSWMKYRVPYGWSLVGLSFLICLIYFVPVARRDAVYRSDGSFNWIYVDTQHFYAIAAGIRGGERPPVGPGTATEELRYHFGPYAPAAIISEATGLPLGDALARVTRGASLWALVLSCFSLGSALSLKATGERFGAIATVAGLFFYGSLLSLFSNEISSASHVQGAILYTIPGVEVTVDGGPFSHLILGHSVLHGLAAITVIMGLCMARKQERPDQRWKELVLLSMPALTIPMNSVAALYSLGVVAILLFWGDLRSLRSWASIVLMLCLFLIVWKAMGLYHAPDSASAGLKPQFMSQWWTLVMGLSAGLGMRTAAFRWISTAPKSSLSILALTSFLGLLAFYLLLRLPDGNEHYGMYYLYCMFSIFAFSRCSTDMFTSEGRIRWSTEWLGVMQKGLVSLAAAGIVMGVVAYVTHTRTGVARFAPKIIVCLVLLGFITAALALMRRNPELCKISSTVISCVLLIGFLAWITPWLNFALGRMKMDVTVSAAEVQGLHRLRTLAKPGEEFATNRHALDVLANRRERSYAYSALSERPVLLEGYLDRGVERLPWFSTLLYNNDLMFSTKDADTLHRIAATYHIHWLVAQPGTDISIPQPLPPWLIAQKDCGSLKIYQIK